MVIKDTNYTKRVPVQLGMLHIDEALSLVMGQEYGKLSATWVRANFPPQLISGSTQVRESEFYLETIKGDVRITKQVMFSHLRPNMYRGSLSVTHTIRGYM